MNKLDILQREDPNTLHINLYKEGMFWKAYELSAYRFVFGIKQCKAIAHLFKDIDHNVVHIGVPEKTLSSNKDKFNVISKEEKICTIEPINFNPNQSFTEWKKSIEDQMPKEPIIKDTIERVITTIRNYDLADKSPMECMLFLSNIKRRLNAKLQ